MKNLAVGCLGAVLGLIVGLALAFAGAQFLQSSNSTDVPMPVPPQADVTITTSAAFINSQMQPAVKQSGLAKQATITLASPNLIQVAATVDANVLGLPLTVNATASMRVSVQRGRILLTVDKVDSGGVTVPQSIIGPTVEKMRAAAESQINQLVQRALQGTTLRVTNIHITPDEMIVDLTSQ